MNTAASFVRDHMTDEDRRAVIQSYVQFEQEGSIGDAPVREFAKKMLDYLGAPDHLNITIWMHHLTFECYRYFYDNQNNSSSG